MKRIIYPTDEGGVAVIIQAPDCGLTIEQIAAKDVPQIIRYEGTGEFETDKHTFETFELQRQIIEPRPYKIIDTIDVPTDRTFRAAWEFSA